MKSKKLFFEHLLELIYDSLYLQGKTYSLTGLGELCEMHAPSIANTQDAYAFLLDNADYLEFAPYTLQMSAKILTGKVPELLPNHCKTFQELLQWSADNKIPMPTAVLWANLLLLTQDKGIALLNVAQTDALKRQYSNASTASWDIYFRDDLMEV